tara:strand:+ start:194 stop:376 length:183 start_codon:yes stop_codon:yes gene_type:complete
VSIDFKQSLLKEESLDLLRTLIQAEVKLALLQTRLKKNADLIQDQLAICDVIYSSLKETL